MMHRNRRYTVASEYSAESLAEQLTNHTWCGCNGFRYKGLLFLNDATSPDGAQEYAVFRPREDGLWDQVESITFSWCSFTQARQYIEQLAAGTLGEEAYTHLALHIQTPEQHGRCEHCA